MLDLPALAHCTRLIDIVVVGQADNRLCPAPTASATSEFPPRSLMLICAKAAEKFVSPFVLPDRT